MAGATEKNNDIEVLRALAVLMVIVHHAKNLINWPVPALDVFYRYFSGGVGVDLFFVISGFVIARSFVFRLAAAKSTEQQVSVVLSFWVRRFFRIIPLAWLWLGVILLATIIFNESGVFRNFSSNWGGAVAAILQVANIRFQDCFMNYDCGATFVYWSLSLEEQFYIVLPLLALIFRGYLAQFLIVVVAYQFIFSSGDAFAFRFEGLIFGVLLAIFARKPLYHQIEPVFLTAKSFSIGLLVFLVVLLFSVHAAALHVVPVAMQFKLVAVVSLVIVWLASYDRNYFMINNKLSLFPLWVGSRSYALYLVHIPTFFFVRECWFRLYGTSQPAGEALAGYLALAVFLLVLFAELSYRLVEVPMRNRGVKISLSLLSKGNQRDSSSDTEPPLVASRHVT